MAQNDPSNTKDTVSDQDGRLNSRRPDEQGKASALSDGVPIISSSFGKGHGLGNFKNFFRKSGNKNGAGASPKWLLYAKVFIVLLIVGGLATGGYEGYRYLFPSTSTRAERKTKQLNEALLKGDSVQALADAKQVLALEPNNVDDILNVANLTKAQNPKDAQQYYVRALDEFKKQDNPDVSGKPIGTYWAAAGLAEQAGLTDQAKQYYQKVIDAASPSDSSEQSLVTQSQAALKRLK